MTTTRAALSLLALFAATAAVTAPTAAAAPVHDPFEQSVVQKINGLRAEQGLSPLRSGRRLARVASRHSRDQLRHDRLSHASGSGTPFGVRMAQLSRRAVVGETVGWLPDSITDRADRLVLSWMQSPGHRAQLMRPRFRTIGVGRWYGAMGARPGLVVTANFSSRSR